ncbi:hypothetical protein, partial [Endobacterium cereale]|uniref:hypothetical protein n=1 Tax=Endobacterium cereale TaxID=2663029 RepID=UPI001AD94FFA
VVFRVSILSSVSIHFLASRHALFFHPFPSNFRLPVHLPAGCASDDLPVFARPDPDFYSETKEDVREWLPAEAETVFRFHRQGDSDREIGMGFPSP